MVAALLMKGLKWLTFSGDSSILDSVDMDELLLAVVGELSELLAVFGLVVVGMASVVGTTRSVVLFEGA